MRSTPLPLDRILFAFAASYHDIAAGSRQQAKKRTRFATGAFCENRAYNKLASVSVIMLHMETFAMIFCSRLNWAVMSQYAFVMLKRALEVEEFYHRQMVIVCFG
jgi:hypothetical protein